MGMYTALVLDLMLKKDIGPTHDVLTKLFGDADTLLDMPIIKGDPVSDFRDINRIFDKSFECLRIRSHGRYNHPILKVRCSTKDFDLLVNFLAYVTPFVHFGSGLSHSEESPSPDTKYIFNAGTCSTTYRNFSNDGYESSWR